MLDEKCPNSKFGFNMLYELNTVFNTTIREGILVTIPFPPFIVV